MSDPITTENLSAAVAEGLRTAISDPEFWKAASSALQAHAKNEAGGWLLGWLKAAASKALLVLVLGLGIYMLGGWAALIAFLKGSS